MFRVRRVPLSHLPLWQGDAVRRLVLGVLSLMLLTGCSQKQDTLDVFAAASLTESMDAIIALYQKAHPDVEIVVTYDSSGTLKRQIEEGADCDVFVSASWSQVEALELDGIAWLSNELVLVVPAGSTKVTSFDDVMAGDFDLLGIGNSDVPAGAYAMEVLESIGVSLAELEAQGKVSYGSNVKEILVQAQQAMVDCAMVYATDAIGAGVDVVAVANEDWYSPAVYPMVGLHDDAQTVDFMAFLQSDAATAVLVDGGFTVLN